MAGLESLGIAIDEVRGNNNPDHHVDYKRMLYLERPAVPPGSIRFHKVKQLRLDFRLLRKGKKRLLEEMCHLCSNTRTLDFAMESKEDLDLLSEVVHRQNRFQELLQLNFLSDPRADHSWGKDVRKKFDKSLLLIKYQSIPVRFPS